VCYFQAISRRSSNDTPHPKPKRPAAPLIDLSLAGLSLGTGGASAVAFAIKHNRRRIVIDADMVDGSFSYLLATHLPTKWAEQVRPQANITTSYNPRVLSLNITSLDLSSTEIGNRGVGILAQALEVNQSIKSLLLQRNGLEGTGAIAIANLLRRNSTLLELGLDHNRLGDGGMAAIAHALGVAYTRELLTSTDCRAVDSASVGQFNEPSFDAAQAHSSLTRLSVQDNRIRHVGASAIATLVRNRPSLTILAFKNPLGDLGTEQYVSALVARGMLSDIELRDCMLSELGIASIAEILNKDTPSRPRSVDLGGNTIGSRLGMFCNALNLARSTTQLNLDRCQLNSASIQALATVLSSDTTPSVSQLRALRTSNNNNNGNNNNNNNNGNNGNGNGNGNNNGNNNNGVAIQELILSNLRITDWSPSYQSASMSSPNLTSVIRSTTSLPVLPSLSAEQFTASHTISATSGAFGDISHSTKLNATAALSLLCKCVGDLPALHTLDLSGTCLDKLSFTYLTSSVGRSATLSKLFLSDCHLTDEELCLLFVAIEHNRACTLTVLDISRNAIGRQTTVALGSMLAVNNSVSHLSINENRAEAQFPISSAFFEGLAINRALIYLDMANWMLGDENLSKMANMLTSNCTLAYLNLRNSQCSDEAAVAFASALYCNTSLTELRLDSTAPLAVQLTERGIGALARSLAVNTSLCFISVSSTVPRNHACLQALSRQCAGNRLLQPFMHIDLSRFVSNRREPGTPRTGDAIESLLLNPPELFDNTSASAAAITSSPLNDSASYLSGGRITSSPSIASSIDRYAGAHTSASTLASADTTPMQLRWLSVLKVNLLICALRARSSYSLTQLDLSHTNLACLPDEISSLTSLRQLTIAHNYFTARSLSPRCRHSHC
jgi:Ran GTPase-activating protein (RanGAP) involved in mRNA processing and transport